MSSEKDRDKELVQRGEMKKAIGIIHGTDSPEFKGLSDVIDKISSVSVAKCQDAVSREAVKKIVEDKRRSAAAGGGILSSEVVLMAIDGLPSVLPTEAGRSEEGTESEFLRDLEELRGKVILSQMCLGDDIQDEMKLGNTPYLRECKKKDRFWTKTLRHLNAIRDAAKLFTPSGDKGKEEK